jgi:hypothetical protein
VWPLWGTVQSAGCCPHSAPHNRPNIMLQVYVRRSKLEVPQRRSRWAMRPTRNRRSRSIHFLSPPGVGPKFSTPIRVTFGNGVKTRSSCADAPPPPFKPDLARRVASVPFFGGGDFYDLFFSIFPLLEVEAFSESKTPKTKAHHKCSHKTRKIASPT